jgi:signal transduction histidine kinase
MFATRSKIASLPSCGQDTASVVECVSADEEEPTVNRNGEWLATLSHELRSPLITILYALESISGTHDLDSGARR